MKYKVILLIFLNLAIFLSFSAFVSGSCCVNEQASFASVTTDITCTDNLPPASCPSGYNGTVGSCSAVPQCGCCVCTPPAGGKQVYSSGDLRVSNNFCAAFCQQATGSTAHQLISGLTAAQCSGQVTAQTVSGRVTDQSGNPVAGATVTSPAGTATTDTGGFYTIGVLAPQTTINVSKSGISTSIQVDTQVRTSGWNVTLTLAARVADLYGKVTPIINNVPSTTPIPNVKIRITDGINTFNTVTDAVGEYRFIGVPIGTYQLTANKCAYYRKSEPAVQVNAPTTEHDILLQPAPKERVVGTVRDTQNRMIPGVDFIVSPPAGSATKSDRNGQYVITGLDSNCQYTITATKEPQYSEQTKVANIRAPPDDRITDNPLDFVLAPGPAFDFCTAVGDCRGPDMQLGTPDDCGCPVNKVCNAMTGECEERPIVDCCDFSFQCQPESAKLAPTPQCAGKVTCANTCAEIADCPVDAILSNANVDGVCRCSGQLVSVVPSLSQTYNIHLASGRYCCPYAAQPITNLTCKAQNKAIVFGTIISKITKEPIDAYIYVDGSDQPIHNKKAEYEVYLDPNQAHTIRFEREPLYVPVTRNVQAFNLKKGVRYRLDIEMRTVEALCNYPTNPPVPDFEAEHVKCKPEARLRWNNNYCRNDLGVQSFVITNINDDEIFIVDKEQDEFVVTGLEWGETYDFTIQAVYADSNRPRASEPVGVSFSPGDEECAGRCGEDEFCLTNTLRRYCDNENKLSSAVSSGSFADCMEHKTAEDTDSDWFCSGPDQQGKTVCLQENKCGYDLSSPAPFLGLLYTDSKCSRNPRTGRMNNGCYLDTSTTTVDFCYPCPKPDSEDFSCYLYDSMFACENNRCNLPGDCRWLPTNYSDLGEGICYDHDTIFRTKYEQIEQGEQTDSRCIECNNQGDLFHNVGCAQDVCSKLGLCYSVDASGSSCAECGQGTACSDFKTRESCISATGEDQRFNLFPSPAAPLSAQHSDDACGLGVCAWDENNKTCYKDGNADGKSDCVSVQFGVESFNPVCSRDTHPPTSTPNYDTFILNNRSDDPDNVVSFNVSEEIGAFRYCLYKEGEEECTDMISISGSNTDYVSGRTIRFNPVVQFKDVIDSVGNYRLRYFSEDVNKNIELLKETVIYVDPSPPGIQIQNYSICLNCEEQIDCFADQAYRSELNVVLSSDELANCEAYLLAPGETRTTASYHDTFTVDVISPMTILYGEETGLLDGDYDLILECVDIVGNELNEERKFRIDSFDLINRVKPRGPVKDVDITYEARTKQVSNCYISIDGREETIMDQAEGAKRHILLKSYDTNTYHTYRIKCIPKFPINPNRCDTEIYDFAVDSAPPGIEAYIAGRRFDEMDWTLYLTESADLVIEAEDRGIQGTEASFGIDHISYCTRDDLLTCDPGTAIDAVRVSGKDKIIIPADRNVKVCYYAVDKGGNRGRVKCGKILFTPIPDIALTSPQPDLVTDNARLEVTASHDVADAADAVVSAFDGKNSISVSASIIDATVRGTLTSLFPGLNVIYARIKNQAGMWGEDSVDVYYDQEGPEIELVSDSVFEYGEQIEIEAEIKDIHWTAVETADDNGDVAGAEAVIQSAQLADNFSLLKAGKIFSRAITPVLLDNNLYNYLPGEYLLTVSAEDRFGNMAAENFNITIVDTSPTDIEVELDDYGTREENTFYTRSLTPTIQASTTEPATCELHITSVTPAVVEDFASSSNGLVHEYDSETYLGFDTGKVQIFSGMIVCTDLFGANPDEVPVTIVHDDLAPDLALFSTLGTKQIEKEDFVYEIREPDQYGLFSTEISARDLRDNEKIRCRFTCEKDENRSCDLTTDTRAPARILGSEDYSTVQEKQTALGNPDARNGEYRLAVECRDRAMNKIEKDLVFYVDADRDPFRIVEAGPAGDIRSTTPDVYAVTNNPASGCEWDRAMALDTPLNPATDKRMNRHFSFTPSGLTQGSSYTYDITCTEFGTGESDSATVNFTINTSGPQSGTYTVKGLAALDLASTDAKAPFITDIDVRTNNGRKGIYVKEFRENYKQLQILDNGDAGNEVVLHLIADSNEKVVCRYSENYQNFAQMENEFYSSGYSFYPESPFIRLSSGTSKRYFVSCRDEAGNTAAPYIVELSVNLNAPARITELSPEGYVDAYPVLKAATVQDVDCVYDIAGRTNNQMKKYSLPGAYGHTSALFPGSVLVVPEGEEQTVTVRCGSGARLSEETVEFTLDKTLPTLTVSSPEEDDILDTPYFSLAGSTEPGAEIEVYVNRAYHGKAEVADDGSFDSEVSFDSSGENMINVVARDRAGNKAERSIRATSTSDAPYVVAIYPSAGLIGEVNEIVAVVRGEMFSPTRTRFEVRKDGAEFSGNVRFDSEQKVLVFKSARGYFSSGEYAVRVVPVDTEGRVGFSKRVSFTLDITQPRLRWIAPSSERAILNKRSVRAVVELQPVTNRRLITQAEIYASSDGIDFQKFDFVKRGSLYYADLELAEGINYVRIDAADLPGTVHHTRTIVVDLQGASAAIEPSGTIKTSRPTINVQFLEDVDLISYSLEEFGEGQSYALELLESSDREFSFQPASQLLSGSYTFSITVEDVNGNNATTTQDFVVDVGDVVQELVRPKNEVASETPFDLVIRTNQDANCRYSRIYDPGIHTSITQFSGMFNQTGETRHIAEDISFIDASYPATDELYVWCEGLATMKESEPAKYEFSIDQTPPEIIDARVEPEEILEYPLQTELFVETDEPAICKYECNSRVLAYEFMEEQMSQTYETMHSRKLESLEDGMTYVCNILCRNLAGLDSETAEVSFNVDTSLGVGLRILKPKNGSASSVHTIPLKVKSENIGECEYALDSGEPVRFSEIGQFFDAELANLSAGEHRVSVSCIYSVGEASTSSTFYIDDTPPSEVTVEVGDLACNSENINVSWQATDAESGIIEYSVAMRSEEEEEGVYDVINFTSVGDANTLPAGLLPNVTAGRYVLAVKAKNRADLWSGPAESDVFLIDPTLLICVDTTPPNITLQKQQIPAKTTVSLQCTDNESGCDPSMLFGVSEAEAICVANRTYSAPVEFTDQKYLCYQASDLAGNRVSGTELITILPSEVAGCPDDLDCDNITNERDEDIDGDGIPNCEDPDDDNDGIPDYNQDTNFNEDFDDDNDGVNDDKDFDVDNDWDNDGLGNGIDDDIDCDGILNCDDTDIDNDGLQNNRHPENNGLLSEADTDNDNDGVPDIDDADFGKAAVPDTDNDLDNDGTPNSVDEDLDGDGTPDSEDDDWDNDGVLNCMDIDIDNDGISNSEDPDYTNDFDEDGMPNDWEEMFGLDKLDPADAAGDADNDGLTNLDEFEHKTDPNSKDSDDDGYSDYDELFAYDQRYDPADPESRPPSRFLFYLVVVVILALASVLGYYGYKYYLSYRQRKQKEARIERAAERRAAAPAAEKPRAFPRIFMPKVNIEEELAKRRRLREERRKEKAKVREKLFGKQAPKKGLKLETEEAEKAERKKARKELEDTFKKLEKAMGQGADLDELITKAKGRPKKKEIDKLSRLIEKRGELGESDFDKLMALSEKYISGAEEKKGRKKKRKKLKKI